MRDVFVEPEPKGGAEGSAITSYTLEFSHGGLVTTSMYASEKEAADAARRHGYGPLLARVRNTDKANPDHWRAG
jgi:hypothetical protein